MHLALQERYRYKGLRRGSKVLQTWRDYVKDELVFVRTLPEGIFVDEEPVWVDALELGEAMLGAYLDHYGKDEQWYVVATEKEFTARLAVPGSSGDPLVDFMSRLDLVARDEASSHGALYIWDHKNLNSVRTNYLDRDDQMGAYWALAVRALVKAGVLKKGEVLTGVLYNILRKAKPDPRPRNADGACLNKDGTVSKVQPSPLFHREFVHRTRAEQNTQIRRIQHEVIQMNNLRTHPDLVIKNGGEHCSWCPLNDMCALHENGDDWQELRDALFRAGDPYAAYRPSTAE
jgi:hypothetical protein